MIATETVTLTPNNKIDWEIVRNLLIQQGVKEESIEELLNTAAPLSLDEFLNQKGNTILLADNGPITAIPVRTLGGITDYTRVYDTNREETYGLSEILRDPNVIGMFDMEIITQDTHMYIGYVFYNGLEA